MIKDTPIRSRSQKN